MYAGADTTMKNSEKQHVAREDSNHVPSAENQSVVYDNLTLQRDRSPAKCLLTLILRRSRTGTVWFYTSTSNKRAARPKLYTQSLTRDLKHMHNRLTLVRISINL